MRIAKRRSDNCQFIPSFPNSDTTPVIYNQYQVEAHYWLRDIIKSKKRNRKGLR